MRPKKKSGRSALSGWLVAELHRLVYGPRRLIEWFLDERAERMKGGRCAAALVCLIALSAPAVALGEEDVPPTSFGACREDTAARLRFIEQRLEDGRTYAQYWWRGWIAFYGLGTIVTSAQAATEDDGGKRADNIVSAVKALGGVVRQAFFRPTAKYGADAMFAIPPTSEEKCLERLATGEHLLRTNAKEARSRYSWRRHFFNFAVNIGGGLIVAEGFDEPSEGLTSAVVGIAVGEAMTWSHPWRGTKDLADYEREFAPVSMPTRAAASWELIPMVGGAGVRVRF
jgi:hypothetical protein